MVRHRLKREQSLGVGVEGKGRGSEDVIKVSSTVLFCNSCSVRPRRRIRVEGGRCDHVQTRHIAVDSASSIMVNEYAHQPHVYQPRGPWDKVGHSGPHRQRCEEEFRTAEERRANSQRKQLPKHFRNHNRQTGVEGSAEKRKGQGEKWHRGRQQNAQPAQNA